MTTAPGSTTTVYIVHEGWLKPYTPTVHRAEIVISKTGKQGKFVGGAQSAWGFAKQLNSDDLARQSLTPEAAIEAYRKQKRDLADHLRAEGA